MDPQDQNDRNALLAQACGRLTRLTRKMLRGFPGVKRWEDTDDVLQSALVRLLQALRDVPVVSACHFDFLAARQIRRELIDLCRHHFGPQGPGANHHSNAAQGSSDSPPYEQPDTSHEPGRLAEWHEFHLQVESLPEAEREVIDLVFYQGLKQAEAASRLGVTVRTVQLRRAAALLKLRRILKAELPES